MPRSVALCCWSFSRTSPQLLPLLLPLSHHPLPHSLISLTHSLTHCPSPPPPVCCTPVQLPETGYLAQVPLLQVFQQLVELRESGRVLGDVHQPPTVDRQYSDTKDILETWRYSVQGRAYCLYCLYCLYCTNVLLACFSALPLSTGLLTPPLVAPLQSGLCSPLLRPVLVSLSPTPQTHITTTGCARPMSGTALFTGRTCCCGATTSTTLSSMPSTR